MTAAAVRRRLAALREILADRKMDAFLTAHPPNVRYLTGFSGSSAWLVVTREEACLFTDGRYAAQVREEVPAAAARRTVARTGLADAFERWASRRGIRRAAFEGDRLSVDLATRLRSGTPWRWQPVRGWVERLRVQKDEEEIAAIRTAAAIAVRCLGETLALVEPGVREADVAAELEYRIRRAAPEGPAFETIVLSGERTAWPHGRTGTRALREGDWLLIDFGVRWNGYCCDVTRTVVLGEPTARQRDVHDAVRTALEAAAAACAAGARARDVDRTARRVLRERGFARGIAHATGHGVGLELHEEPRLHRSEEARLPPDAVVTLEPGLYFPEWGGVRIEDDYRVTDNGPEWLTPFPRACRPA